MLIFEITIKTSIDVGFGVMTLEINIFFIKI
jgi:hypothetical protein